MLNNIIDGILLKLNKTFKGKYNIYIDNIKQGLKEPCFFINLLNTIKQNLVGPRYIKDYYFIVQYFPISENEKNKEINKIAEKLCQSLEYIKLKNKDLIRGSNINYEIVNDILNFYIKYSLFILNKEKKDKMGKLNIKNNINR